MRFEYCCREMKEFLGDYATVRDNRMIDIDGWEVRYCPFCGEKVEMTTYVHGEKEESE